MMITVVEDLSTFQGMRRVWNSVLEASLANSVFLTWEWLYSWWQHMSENGALRLIVFWHGIDIVGFAPLILRSRRISRALGMRTVEFLAGGKIGSDYLDVIVARGFEEEATVLLAEYLVENNNPLRLSQIRRNALVTHLYSRLQKRRWNTSLTTINVCPFISLAGTDWESYLATLGNQHRYNFRRRLRNLNKSYNVSLRAAKSTQEREQYLSILRDLHLMRWASSGSDLFEDAAYCEFHQDFTAEALKRGWLRLYVLWLDDQPAAAFYGLLYNGTFSFYQSGFDARYSRQSVGLVTMGLAIHNAIEEGATEFDFLHGNESYKSLWTRETRVIERLDSYPPGIRGELYRHALGAGRRVKRRLCFASI